MMPRTHLAILAALAVLPWPEPMAAQPARLGRLAGVWVGQDGRDFVGPSTEASPSGVQDIHIRLTGLPARVGIERAEIRGFGGDEWQFQGPYGPWKAHLIRRQGTTSADLFLEPTRVESGRAFTITLTFDDGRTAELTVQGGRADPNLRMPSARLAAHWRGQDGRDRVGPGPAVGPDGVQDAVIMLENLSPKIAVKAVAILAPDGAEWQSGVNPRGLPNAELIRQSDDPAKADLFLNPDRDRDGQTFRVIVLYANDKRDEARVVAGRTDPGLRMPLPILPVFIANQIQARWVGQDGSDHAGPGSVRVALENLPTGEVVAAALTDPVGGAWIFKAQENVPFEVATYPMPLVFQREADRAGLSFPPIRDESGAFLTLRLLFADGRQTIARIPGGPADPALRAGPGPRGTSVNARPGDDLNDLANRFGMVRLAKGTYHLNHPLILNQPVTIIGDPGSTLLFDQPDDAPPWTSAIQIHAGRTTLEGFAVRFAGPVRWATDIDYGPAVIGTADDHDPGTPGLKAGLIFRNLDLESPPPATRWEEAVRLIRLATAENGRIEGNTLRGGMIEFLGGPWIIQNNDYRGTPPGTFCFGVFAGHRTHDLVLADNTARPVGPSGKTWRFLVLTISGASDRIRDNRVAGIGPRDDDTVHENAPEIILTEAYRLRFEGRPRALSDDGLILKIPEPQGTPAEPGDAVAILNGPHAGTFHRVAQRIDRTTYLIDPMNPLPRGDYDLSMASGFVGERFAGNTIDGRGGSKASGFVLVGNHYGTVLTRNHILGCGEALRLTAMPAESPGPWGWSHAPAFGLRVERNTIEGAYRGATLAVEHGPPVKTSAGRVYLSASVRDNTFRHSPAFTIGDPRSTDLGELIVTTTGNRLPGTLNVHAATLDGQAVRSRRVTLPTISAEPGQKGRASPSTIPPSRPSS